MHRILPYFLLLLPLLLTAQTPAPRPQAAESDYDWPSTTSRLYAVQAAGLLAVLNGEKQLGDLPPSGPYYPATTPRDSLPPGHYLRVRVTGSTANYQYFHTHTHTLRATARRGRFHLEVFDPAGQARTDARVLADGKPVRYRPRARGYERRDWRIDDLVVFVGGDTLFYEVEEEVKSSRFVHDWRVVRARQPLRLLLQPYYFGQRAFRYVRHGIRSGEWYRPPYPLAGLVHRVINPPAVAGYVALDKPKYLPGDTVRVSAYLSYPRGRPVGVDSIEVRIGNYRDHKRLRVAATARGVYTFDFLPPADWALDRDYGVDFYLPGLRWREVGPSGSFRLEDYELPEYELEVTASTETRAPNTAWLDVRTEDVNGLPLPRGEVRVTTLLTAVGRSVDTTRLVLPDTLHVHREGVGNRLERRIILPDSLFPYGHEYEIETVTRVSAPSGEYEEERVPLTVDRRYRRYPVLDLTGPAFVPHLAPASAPQTGLRLLAIGTRADTTELPLTDTLAIDHTLSAYELRYGEQRARLDIGELTPATGKPFRWSRDTLRVYFPNPQAQPLRWTLLRGQKVLATGTEASGPYSQPGFAPEEELRLEYRYLAGGRWHHRRQDLLAPAYKDRTVHRNVLDFQLEQPPNAPPGSTVPVTLTVTDQRGRPAPNVTVAAGTYNARFEDRPVDLPDYRSRRRYRRQRQGYEVTEWVTEGKAAPPAWLVRDLKLDTALLYQLHYPDPEFTHRRGLDSILPAGNNSGHLAVFVMRNNRPEAVRTVYANNRLVYWYHPGETTPYSIALPAGRPTISVRTDRARYEKQLTIDPREQLVLSFDADRTGAAGWSFEPLKEPTQRDLKDIHDRAFVLVKPKNGTFTLARQRADGFVHTTILGPYSTTAALGLAAPEEILRVGLQNGKLLRVPFDRHFKYEISSGRDRLFPLTLADIERSEATAVEHPIHRPGVPFYRYPLPTPTDFTLPPLKNPVKPTLPEDRTARLQFSVLPLDIYQVVISNSPWYGDFALLRGEPNRLPPDTYDLVYYLRDGSLRTQRVTLAEDQLTVLAYRKSATRVISTEEAFGLYSHRPAKKTRPTPAAKTTLMIRGLSRLPTAGAVTGRVVDEDGDPLIGVTILVDGTNSGTVTDFDGMFQLLLPAGKFDLWITYVGYEPQRVSDVAAGRVVSVVMIPDVNLLEEVVVVGYGSVSNLSDLTGSVAGLMIHDGLSAFIADPAVSLADLSPELQALATQTEVLTDDQPTTTALPAATPRANFADAATFHPYLRTDRRGRARFDVTLPDNITAWNTYAVGQDRRRRVGFAEVQTRSFLPLQAQLYLPRFLVAGDRSQARTLVINRTAEPHDLRLTFGEGAGAGESRDSTVRSALETNYPIAAPAGRTDSLVYRFGIVDRGDPTVTDGEERAVPIFPQGSMATAGSIFYVEEGMSLPAEFIRPERGPVTLRLFGNRVDQLLVDVDKVVDYPYACLEQTASRLVGLLALKSVRAAKGEAWTEEQRLLKTLARLKKFRRGDGGYGWWPDSKSSSVWISHHVYRALTAAEAAGYPAGDLRPLRRYLLGAVETLPRYDRLQVQLTFAEEGNPPLAAELAKLDSLVLRDTLHPPTDYERLALARLRQTADLTISTQALLPHSEPTALGGRYWGSSRFRFRRQPLRDRLAATLLALRIFDAADQAAVTEEIVRFLLSRSTGEGTRGSRPVLGTNTLESAVLIAELLPFLAKDGQLAPPTVRLRGVAEEPEVATFPYTTRLAPAAAKDLRLERSGSGPLPAVVYQRYFETEPQETASGFRVTTRFVDSRNRPVERLRLGETVYLEARVRPTADADYVLVELPVPAGCSYADREEAKNWWVAHREYRRDRVAFFCNRLSRREYVFRVALQPRFAGEYTLNPARAEMQYVPAVNGMTGLRRVTVE